MVRCPGSLRHRAVALDWLHRLAELQPQGRGEEVEASRISARYVDATWPRRYGRLDVAPAAAKAVDGESKGLGAVQALGTDLHDVAVQCLEAIAGVEGLQELLGLVAPAVDPELLHTAREPSLLRSNLYPTTAELAAADAGRSADAAGAGPAPSTTGPCWHVDLGLLTVTPAGSWPALMVSPFHEAVGENAFLEELLEPDLDVLVFAGTTLVLASGGRYTALVHGVSQARSARGGRGRVSTPYFLRARRGAVLERPQGLTPSAGQLFFPAAVELESLAASPGELPESSLEEVEFLDLIRFHRDLYGRLCTRGQVVKLEALASAIAAGGADAGAAALRRQLLGLRAAPRAAAARGAAAAAEGR